MKKRHRHLVLILVIVGVAIYLWLGRSGDQETLREDPSLVFNRLWVDSVQKKETDYVHAFVVVTKLPVGLFQKASQYRIEAERFDYRHRKSPSRLLLNFPQTEKEATVRYRVRACNDLPPYDLCLELPGENPWGGPRRYYGMREQSRAGERHRRMRDRALSQLR